MVALRNVIFYLFFLFNLPFVYKDRYSSTSREIIMAAVAAVNVPFLISRVGDPIFAAFVGSTAAFLRIRREEQDKGIPFNQLWPTLRRRAGLIFA